jgi:hypothetical protein
VGGLSELRRGLWAIAEDVALGEDGRALVAGERVDVAGPEGPCAGLAQAIYGRFYCRPAAAPAEAEADAAAFLETLRAANPIAPRWEAWTVTGSDAYGLILSQPSGAVRRAAAGEVAAGPGGLAVGQPVHLAAAREMLTAARGHFAILGRPVVDAGTGRQVRFYWNLEPAGAARFLAEAGGGLERRRIPFQAKVPADPRDYGRADTGVLYLAAEDVAAAADIVAGTYEALRAVQGGDTPLFARRLAPGLAFAESPPGGESFGIHRSRLAAEGLVQAGPGADAERKSEAMLARFAAYGLDLEAPERNAGTSYPYEFPEIAG